MKDEDENIQNGEGSTEGRSIDKGLEKQSVSRGSSRLTSTPPPLTTETIHPVVKQQKELVEYMQRHNDLPLDWPFCTYSGKGVLGRTQEGEWINDGRDCCEVAGWAVRLSYHDEGVGKDNPLALLCSGHFAQLPAKPDGSLYRIFRLTINNYKRFLDESRSIR